MAGRRYALVIGNSDYKDKRLSKLTAPTDDATTLADILRHPDIGNFEVTCLINETGELIRKEIAKFFSNKEIDDTLLIYFSGHGLLDHARARLYLAATDTDTDLIRATAISAPFISEEMDDSISNRKILILDCCHSGAFELNHKGTTGGDVGTEKAFKGEGYGRIIITATDSIQSAFQGNNIVGETKHSAFTHFLIEGLRSGAADMDKNGRVTSDEAFQYICNELSKTKAEQTPRRFVFNQDGNDLLLAWSRTTNRPLELLDKDLLAMIRNKYPTARKSAIVELRKYLYADESYESVWDALILLSDDSDKEVVSEAKVCMEEYTVRAPVSLEKLKTLYPEQGQVICKHCGADRPEDLKIACSVCGSRDLFIFGYAYPNEISLRSNLKQIVALLLKR